MSNNYQIHLNNSGRFMIHWPDNSVEEIGNHFPATYTGKKWVERIPTPSPKGPFDVYFFEVELPASLAKALKVPVKVVYCTASGIVGPNLADVLEVGQLQIFRTCRHRFRDHTWYVPVVDGISCNSLGVLMK